MQTSSAKYPAKFIHELYFLRFIACISVVFIHSISISFPQYPYDGEELFNLKQMQMLFMFATPTFIWIAQMILGYSYRDRKPKNFWINRCKYLLLPYFFMGFLTALLPYIRDWNTFQWGLFLERLLRIYFLGEWVGYFVIIIFQCYLLYYFGRKWLDRLPVWLVITTSFIVNTLYLYHLNFGAQFEFLNALSFYPYAHLPIFGWIFFFAVGYYCGKYIEDFIHMLHRFRYLFLLGALLSFLMIWVNIDQQILTTISSKRVDILPYTIFVIFSLFYLANYMKRYPAFVYLISQASYGIYLTHSVIQSYVIHWRFLSNFEISPGLYITVQFVLGVIGSFCLVYLLNQWKYGPYLVGKASFSLNNLTSNEKFIYSQK